MSKKPKPFDQISAKRGPDLTFAVEANTKTLCPSRVYSISKNDGSGSSYSTPSRIFDGFWCLYRKDTEQNYLPRCSYHLLYLHESLPFNLYSRILNENDQTRITNCKSRFWMCKLEYSNISPIFDLVFDPE